jgi:hypothetical protein
MRGEDYNCRRVMSSHGCRVPPSKDVERRGKKARGRIEAHATSAASNHRRSLREPCFEENSRRGIIRASSRRSDPFPASETVEGDVEA